MTDIIIDNYYNRKLKEAEILKEYGLSEEDFFILKGCIYREKYHKKNPIIYKTVQKHEQQNEKHYVINRNFFEIIEKHNIHKNLRKLQKLLDEIKSYQYYSWTYIRGMEFIIAKYDNSKTNEEKIDTIIRFANRNTNQYMCNLEGSFTNLYEIMFNKEERADIKNIGYIIKKYHRYVAIALDYVDPEDKKHILETYPKEIYKNAREFLTTEELFYLISIIREKDDIYLGKDKSSYNSIVKAIMVRYKCNLLEKLKKIYGKLYIEQTGKSPDKEDEFVYALLKSEVLEHIYTKSLFTVKDATIINTILNSFESNGLNVKKIRENQTRIITEEANKERSFSNFVTNNQNNKETLINYLKGLKINRNNFFKFVSSRKFLDKKLKTTILLILSKTFNSGYISVFDILDMIQEANERELTLNDILEEKEIDIKYFNQSYKELKDKDPAMYELIEASKNNKNKNKLLKLYNTIMHDGITNYEEFVKKYKQTPEELLELFSETPLFDKVHYHLLTWYDFKNGLPELKGKKAKN